MMAIAGHNINVEVIALDPKGKESPTGQVAQSAVQGSFKDADKIKELAQALVRSTDDEASTDRTLTVEIEHVDVDAMEAVAREMPNIAIYPSPETIRLVQDKYRQKEHMRRAGNDIPTSPFEPVETAEDCRAFGATHGYPYMLKARTGAYDGKGNYVVRDEAAVEEAVAALSPAKLYAEAWCDFDRELAVMVLRGRDGTVRAYPVVEFSAKDSICRTTLCPAQVSLGTARRAVEVAKNVVSALPEGAVGVFGVELFAMKGAAGADLDVMYNEIAPRPHNSGHYTIEACDCSQFEAHVRAVAGLPLPESLAHRVGASVMVNTVGESSLQDFERLVRVPGAAGHWYGKKEPRAGRKMGHVTVCAASMAELHEALRPVADLLDESDGMPPGVSSNPLVGVIMGSDSDLPTMKAATAMLDQLRVPYEVTVVSAHRTPRRMYAYAEAAAGRGIKVIIAGAGGAAHLPGMVAALTTLPVVGVPVKTSTLNGVDSLLSIVQMPRGIPVATVAIGNAKNAGLLAARMIAAYDAGLTERLVAFQNGSRDEVERKAEKLERVGAEKYVWP
jgi:phosphoribosylaminoimidazole carboxylase